MQAWTWTRLRWMRAACWSCAMLCACSAEPVRRYGAPDLAALAATARRLLLLCIDHVRPQPSAHPA